MKRPIKETLGLIAFCGVLMMAAPMVSMADEISGPGLASGNYIATVEAENVNINKDETGSEVLMTASKGTSFQVMEDAGDGWMKVKVKDTYGYLPTEGATVSAVDQATIEALENSYNAEAEASANLRQNIVNYALQFVGGRYVYGGNDPHTGVDCSGFTRYVMQHAAGVSLSRNSGGQASQGRAISSAEMRPGDLIFYGNGRSINHVAMYIGNGQIVHASTYKTGIKTSVWNYRSPVKIVNVLGD